MSNISLTLLYEANDAMTNEITTIMTGVGKLSNGNIRSLFYIDSALKIIQKTKKIYYGCEAHFSQDSAKKHQQCC